MNLKQIRKVIIILVFLLLGVAAGWQLHRQFGDRGGRPLAPGEKADLTLFWEVWSRLEENFLDQDKLVPEAMVDGAIKGMVDSLGDPYTVFLREQENQRFKEDLNGSFEGIGVQLGYQDKRLVVMAPLAGMPAEEAGVKAGDLILRIKDEKKNIDQETTDLSLPEAVNLIRGPEGQAVILTLLSEGEEKTHEVKIIRETIVVPSVELEFAATGEVAHLKLMRFGDRTEQEWREAVDQIQPRAGWLKGVVLDLRNNPGGYLEGSVFIASEFVKNGLIVKQEGKGETQAYNVNRRGRLTEMPLVVLVNQGTASASEILAGSLRDHQRAQIVGEQTFGKGTVQEDQDLAGGAGLHVTTARWLLPSGSWIGEEGLTPDFVIELAEEKEGDEQLKEAIEILLK